MSLFDKIQVSFFQSVTTRTAGFATIPQENLTNAAAAVSIILMLIGGSPVGTAGGMKTTTIAVLVSSALSVFRKKKDTHFFKRRIPDYTVKSAASIFLLYIGLFIGGGMIISRLENIPLLPSLFETASAIGTVGLSLGITSQLGIVSQFILIVLMFLGRVGGLTLIFAAMKGTGTNVTKYPQEKITVG